MAMIETISAVTDTEVESETTKIALSLFANPQITQGIPEKDTGSRKKFISDLINNVQVEFNKRHQIVLTVYIHLGDNPNRMPQRLIYALFMLIFSDPIKDFLPQDYKNKLNKTFKEYCYDITHESTRTTEKAIGTSNRVVVSGEQSAKTGLKLDFNVIAPFVEVSQVSTSGVSQENSDNQKIVSQVKSTSHQINDEVDAANSLANLFKKDVQFAFYYDWFQNIKREFTYILEKRSTSEKVGTAVVQVHNFGFPSKVKFVFSFFLKAISEFRQSKKKFKIVLSIAGSLLNPYNFLGVKKFKTLYIVDGVNIKDDKALDNLLSQFKILFGTENCMFLLLAPESILAKIPR